MSRTVKLLAMAGVLALVAASCAPGDEPAGREGGSALAQLGEPDFLDPAHCATTTCSEVLLRVFDPLINYNPETAEPEFTAAAESVDINEDATVVTFTLRQGATFHNGEPVNAEAFVRAITRVALEETASAISYHLDGIVGFEDAQAGASDQLAGVRQGANELELVFELEESNAEFFIRTGHTVYSPIPAAALEDEQTFNEEPIGNGPYRMKGPWQHNVGISLEKYPDYNGPRPGFLDEIEWKIYADVDQAYIEFEGLEIDATSVPPEQFTAAAAAFGDAFVDQASAVLNYLLVSTQVEPFDNKLVRQALSMSINREDIARAIFDGQRVPAESILPPANAAHRPGACQYCTFDPDRAQQLLEESGVDVQRIDITFNSGAGHEDWIAAVAANIEETLGINVRIRPGGTDFGDYIRALGNLNGLGRLGWGQDYPSPDNWLFPLFFSTSGDNFSQYNNPDFDATVRQAQQTLDADERLRLYQQAEDMVLEDLPVLPIIYGRSAYAYNAEKFENFVIDVQLANPVWELISIG